MLSAGLIILIAGLALVLLSRLFFGKKTKTVPFVIATPRWLPWICVGIVLLPVLLSLVKSRYQFNVSDIQILALPFLLTLLSALFATLYATAFAIASKIIFPRMLSRFHSRSMMFFLLVFLMQLIPSICLFICGDEWLNLLGENGFFINFIYVIGHAILIFPVLGSFVIVTHFALPFRELDWQSAHHVSLKDIVRYDFYKRFRLEYILTYFFACIFIWNDRTLNSVLSDFITSFSDKMQRAIDGRAANDSTATLFALTAFFISLICFYLWLRVINKNNKKDIVT